jgi:hypothetical protein
MATLRVCPQPGCPSLTTGGYCRTHAATSTRNHRGIPRQARGLGAEHDRNRRAIAAAPPRRCELRLPGCTGIATSPQHRLPRSRGGTNDPVNVGAACGHCQNAEGAALARAG